MKHLTHLALIALTAWAIHLAHRTWAARTYWRTIDPYVGTFTWPPTTTGNGAPGWVDDTWWHHPHPA